MIDPSGLRRLVDREHRAMAALGDTGVPVRAMCDGRAVIGTAFDAQTLAEGGA